jgi:hypothetical protein
VTLLANDQPELVPPDRLDPLLEGENASQRFYTWIQGVSERTPLEGSGSPEGSLEANKGRLYIDRDGVQGQRIYMKTTNGGNTGWQFA